MNSAIRPLKADDVVSEGLGVAARLLDNDINPDNPNKALKAWWPSTDAYSRLIEIETKISHPVTAKMLQEIKAPDIRALESIMFARALPGLPMKRVTVAEKIRTATEFARSTTVRRFCDMKSKTTARRQPLRLNYKIQLKSLSYVAVSMAESLKWKIRFPCRLVLEDCWEQSNSD